MTALTLTGVGHAFFGRTVLSGVSLSIRRGEVVALVGPSGCGKSTLAHIAASLISAREGRVTHDYRRHAMVFQDPRLLPWRSAAGNIAYPLELSGMSRRERDLRVRQSARMVQFEDQDLDKYPVELSGGMRQRVAIARALAIEPDFVFFDEPFTALDVALKRRMQDLVIAAARQNRFAALFITHDLMEAIRVAHRILVMHHNGQGLIGERVVDGEPGHRDDAGIFASMQAFLRSDIAFAHIHDVDERRRT